MGFSDFWLQSNNGKKFCLDNLKELRKSDLGNNSALIRIFNIFDTQNSEGTKGADGVLDKEELASLFRTMFNAAKSKGNASIFEEDEAEEYINTTRTSEGKSLKELGVKVSDLFKFLGALMPKETVIPADVAMPEIPDRSYTPEEIEDISIQTLTDDVKEARQIFNSQNENQGVVSDIVNGTKETFDTEYAASRVNRYIMREELCAELLEKSKSKVGLSEKEYLEAKIDLAVRMLPQLKSTSLRNQIIQNISLFGAAYRAFSKKSRAEQERIIQEIEIELLKDALRKLTPEGLTELIDNIASASDEGYKREAAKYAEQMVKNSLDEKILNKNNQRAPLESRGIINYKYEPVPGSIEQIEKRSSIYRKMTFEETFEAERCVPYNSNYIMDYAEKDAQMQFVLSMHNKRQQIYNILHNPTVAADSKNQFGDVGSGTKLLEQQLEGAIITALRNLYGDDIEKMQEGLNKLGIPGIKIVTSGGFNNINSLKLVFVGEDIDNPTLLTNKTELNSYDLVNVANKLQSMVDANYENALAGKTIDEYSQEAKSAYIMAYGAKNAQDMAEAFAQSQQEGVQTVKTVTQTGAMLVMVAGQLIPVGGQAAAVMIYGGLATSAIGSAGISALENYTKAGGPTEEDKKEMLQELATGVALVSSGMWIGRTSEAAFRALIIKNCPKLLAFASEIGIDVTMSLVADYAITGQIDLSGEGIAQLQAILVGILHAKGNFKTYLDTHAGDITTKSNSTESKPKTDDATLKKDNAQRIEVEPTQKASGSDADGTEVPRPRFGLEEESVVKQEKTNTETRDVKIETLYDNIINAKSREELISILKDNADPKVLSFLNDLSEKDFVLMKKAINSFCHNYEDGDNIGEITNLINILKEHCKLRNRSISDELDFIDKILSEPSVPGADLIDSIVGYRIPNSVKRLDIMETLMKLRETCDNPLLNIDNICELAYEFENISDINILLKRIKAKNADGTYKYGVNDYTGVKYDIDPEMRIKDTEIKKQNLLDSYRDYPDVQQKIKELLIDADEDMIQRVKYKLEFIDSEMPKDRYTMYLLAELNKLDVNYLKSETNILLSNIEDQAFRNIVNEEIKSIENANLTRIQKIDKFQNILSLVDSYYNMQGKAFSINSPYWKGYINELAKTNPELAAKLRGEEIIKNTSPESTKISQTQDEKLHKLKQFIKDIADEFLIALGFKRPNFDIDSEKITKEVEMERLQKYYEYLQKELSETQRVEQFIQYCKNNKNEICDYLYNEIYLNSRNFSSEVKQRCSQLSEKYGVKVFLEADITDGESIDLLKDIDAELNIWKTKSNGNAEMPPVLDLTVIKKEYMSAAGFAEVFFNYGAISINGKSSYHYAMRHEMTHINDTSHIQNFPDNFIVKENDEIVASKCKYYDEFVKIGIPECHIEYAYTKPQEFIAVASEGDLTKCSPEFKQVLIEFGMPEWRFDF